MNLFVAHKFIFVQMLLGVTFSQPLNNGGKLSYSYNSSDRARNNQFKSRPLSLAIIIK